jgi:hypothetical protein
MPLCPTPASACAAQRHTQELELANKYITTLDALLSGSPAAAAAAAAAASGGTGSSSLGQSKLAGGASGGGAGGSPAAAAAATAAAVAAAAALDPAAVSAAAGGLGSLRGSLGLAGVDARVRRVLEGQVARVEAAEVCVALCV